MVGECCFSWTKRPAASDDGGGRACVVRCSEGGLQVESGSYLEQAGCTPDAHDFERSFFVKTGEDGRQTAGEHALAGARRTLEEEVVLAGGCNFNDPASPGQAPQLTQIRTSGRTDCWGGRVLRGARLSPPGYDPGFFETLYSDNFDSRNQAGFAQVVLGNDDTFQFCSTSGLYQREHPSNPLNLPRKTEFAERKGRLVPGGQAFGCSPGCSDDPKGDR